MSCTKVFNSFMTSALSYRNRPMTGFFMIRASVMKVFNEASFWEMIFFIFGLMTGEASLKTSVKGKRANLKMGVSRKHSTPNFPKKEHFLPADTHTYVCVSGGKNARFSENLAFFVFLKQPFWDSPFSLITDEKITSLDSFARYVIRSWHGKLIMTGRRIFVPENFIITLLCWQTF